MTKSKVGNEDDCNNGKGFKKKFFKISISRLSKNYFCVYNLDRDIYIISLSILIGVN